MIDLFKCSVRWQVSNKETCLVFYRERGERGRERKKERKRERKKEVEVHFRMWFRSREEEEKWRKVKRRKNKG